MIFADHDEGGKGQAAADQLRARAVRSGMAVTLMTPTIPGSDWCDVWAGRDAALIEATAA